MATLDTLQDAVNALTSSTTSLLTEVNVNKTTLVNSATNAAASAASASSDKISAAASASQASGSATQAAASADSASAIVLGVASGYPSIAPSLMLDFANTKTLDPRITFSRASTGAYYDGKTVAKAEENLLTYSEQFDNAIWAKTNTTITANSTTAPDGTTTGDTFNASAGSFATRLSQLTALVAGVPSTLSVFAKAGTHSFVQISSGYGSTYYADFDVATGVVGALGAGFSSSSIVSVGGGWYRCTVTMQNCDDIYISMVDSASATHNQAWNPVGTETIYIWGAQLEQRSAVTAYTPTTTAPITNYVPVLQTAAANVARFDHNPTTGESLGLLIEEQRTNLILQSQFASGWSATRATLRANQIIAPDGTLTGAKLIEDTSANSHFISQNATIANSTAHTFTFYAKAGGRNWVTLWVTSIGTSSNTYFDLQNGVLGTVGTGVTATIAPAGNGWFRCSVTGTSVSTATTAYIGTATANNTNTAAGDGYSGVFLWGAQLEAGSFATSYIPTTSAQVTRAVDVATMTGTNFSSWYRADEGTIFVEAKSSEVGLGTSIVSATDNTANNRIQISSLTTVQGLITASGASQASLDGGTPVANVFSKYALSYKLNDCALSLDSAAVATDTSVIVPILTQLEIGTRQAANNINGTIKKLAYYPKRLTNTELQAVTTA